MKREVAAHYEAGFSAENVRFMKPGGSHATIFFCTFLLCEKCKRQIRTAANAAGCLRSLKMLATALAQRKNAAKIDYCDPKISFRVLF